VPPLIAAATLHHLLDTGSTLALLDVRELGEYDAAHIPGASCLPRRLIELRASRLVPCPGVQVVVCDDDERRARLAARTLEKMGYARVAVLEGGVNRWASLDLPIEQGWNVPGKDFGEKVQVRHQVPTLEATDLKRRLDAGEAVVIVDTRTAEEYRKASIPGARCVPGGELALRIADIAGNDGRDTAVVVHCAGRPRAILAAHLLHRMGMRNVFSLRNGISGWVLAGLELERGAARVELPSPSAEALAAATSFAHRLAEEDGVRYLTPEQLEARLATPGECRYLVDVRTEPEFAAGHIPGFWWFPGGQTVLQADDVVAVRNAAIVFCCDGLVRSTVAASWYRQMGFPNVYAVRGGTSAWTASGRPLEQRAPETMPFGMDEARRRTRTVEPRELHRSLTADDRAVVFVDTSREFAAGHVPGARWILRSVLELQARSLLADPAKPVVVTDADGRSAPLAALTLGELGYQDVSVLAGGMAAWRAEAGLPLELGLTGVMAPPEDVVPTGADRPPHQMINYLRWEEALGLKYEAPA
jgi:rhodanese-related sulfurtransferase